MRHVLAFVLSLYFLAPQVVRAGQVDLELVLLADATGSIGNDEIKFQRQGYADALADPDILDAIRAGGRYQKIAVTYIEWGDAHSHEIIVPWTEIANAADAAHFNAALMAEMRRGRGRNAIGSALMMAANQIESNDVEGTRKVIDLSGDSANSWGRPSIAEARQSVLDRGITINGLAILCRTCSSGRPVSYDLEKAFEDTIIGGAGSFVISADDPQRFSLAVKRKLILEIANRSPAERFAEN